MKQLAVLPSSALALSLVTALGVASPGCGDGSVTGPIDEGDGASGDPGPSAYVLAFVGTTPVISLPAQSTTLRFRLTQGTTTPVPDATVSFELSGNGGSLNVTSATTDPSGNTSIHFIAGTAAASLELTASADQANPVTIAIEVQIPSTGDINVNVTSTTRIPVSRAEISMFVTSSSTSAYSCPGLYGSTTLPTTPYAFSLTNVPGQHLFSDLATGSVAAVIAYGYTAAGDQVARGCVDNVTVAGGVVTPANVSFTQLPTPMTGDYDALVAFDLGDALPQPYEGYVDTVTTWLGNPAAVITYYILAQVDDFLTITGFLDVPGSSPTRRATLAEILADSNMAHYVTFRTLSAGLDTKLSQDGTVGPTYNATKTVAANVRTMVSAFEMGSRLDFGAQVGVTGKYPIDEMYQAMVFTWQLGCAQGDTGCIRRAISLSETTYSPIHANYDDQVTLASIAGTSERFKALAPPHPIPFSYGAVILVGLSEVAFPSICTGCSSLGDVMGHLINCSGLGSWLSSQLGGIISASAATGFCTTGLSQAATYVTNEAVSLTTVNAAHLESVDPTGGQNGGELYLIDADQNLQPELLRDLRMNVRWADPASSIPPPDVTAPATGKGRRAATDCATDSACAATESCQLIPSYLEVRELETTCKKAVGAVAGRDNCTQNAECRSGTCVRPGNTGTGKCFLACDTPTDCGGATCDPNRTTVSLETTRTGLGNAYGQGCGP